MQVIYCLHDKIEMTQFLVVSKSQKFSTHSSSKGLPSTHQPPQVPIEFQVAISPLIQDSTAYTKSVTSYPFTTVYTELWKPACMKQISKWQKSD